MIASDLFQKRKLLFYGVLFAVLFTFVFDILDLREELQILSCPYSYLDSNVTTSIISDDTFNPRPILIMASGKKKASVDISFIHLLPYGFRAPPVES